MLKSSKNGMVVRFLQNGVRAGQPRLKKNLSEKI